MEIVELLPDEWETFYALRQRAIDLEPLAFGTLTTEPSNPEHEYGGRLNRDDRQYFFAKEGDTIVGMMGIVLSAHPQYQHTAVFVNMFVEPDYRRKGVAKRMIEHAIEWLAKQGREKVKLEVTSSQEAAIKLYWECGFREVGRHKNEVCHNGVYYDDILMERFIKKPL